MPIATIAEALADLEDGKFIVIVDDEDRENEGDLCVAAQLVTPAHIAFMSRHAGGLICTPLIAGRLDELGIEPMVNHNTSRYGTAFSVSVEARDLVTTGISAYDRAATIRHLVDLPLRAAEGGVLKRAGQTEASVDLVRMAGLYPAGVICEVMNDDGTMARMPDLERFSSEHDIKIVTIKDLIAYRRRNEKLVQCRVVTPNIPIRDRVWTAHAYEDLITHDVHMALVLGEIDSERPVLLRVHSCCLTGDVFGSMRCDCGPQLRASMEMIEAEGSGVVLYIGNHEGRGIGLINKLRAYNLQDEGLDTVEANEALDQPTDSRDYGPGVQILYDLGVREMRLLTNNPRKLIGIEGYGLRVVAQVPIKTVPNPYNERYLRTKKEKLGHNL